MSDPRDARLVKQSKTKTPNCSDTIKVRSRVKMWSPHKTLSVKVEKRRAKKNIIVERSDKKN